MERIAVLKRYRSGNLRIMGVYNIDLHGDVFYIKSPEHLFNIIEKIVKQRPSLVLTRPNGCIEKAQDYTITKATKDYNQIKSKINNQPKLF